MKYKAWTRVTFRFFHLFFFFSSFLHLHSSEVETGNGQTQSVPIERSVTAEMETLRPARDY